MKGSGEPANTTDAANRSLPAISFSTNLFDIASKLGKVYDNDIQEKPDGGDSSGGALLPSYSPPFTARSLSRRGSTSSVRTLTHRHSKHASSTKLSPFHHEEYENKRAFTLKLIRALLFFGSPSHRIEGQLVETAKVLQLSANFVHIPDLIIVVLGHGELATRETIFVREKGHIALSPLQDIHAVYRHVLHREMSLSEGTEILNRLLKSPPLFGNAFRSSLAFLTSAIICVTLFGGSILDMLAAGFCASILNYFGLVVMQNASSYSDVYEITTSIGISFLASALSSIPGHYFCYSAISSAAVVQVLPGFIILIAALELASKNILCGAVRMVYAITYTLFLGFGLTIGSELFSAIYPKGRTLAVASTTAPVVMNYFEGFFTAYNGSSAGVSIPSVFAFTPVHAAATTNIIQGCYRTPNMLWYMQTIPGWVTYLLVPVYAACVAILNLQRIRSPRIIGMILFASCTHLATAASVYYLPSRSDIIAALGAFTIGVLGNMYSRTTQGSAFVMMVPSVLFLVPCALALGGGGLAAGYSTSDAEMVYQTSFSLAIRIVQVAVGVASGLFCSQLLVYLLDTRKNKAKGHRNLYFAF